MRYNVPITYDSTLIDTYQNSIVIVNRDTVHIFIP